MTYQDPQEKNPTHPMAKRFRGFLPVVVDVETGGFNPETDALLEIAAVTLRINSHGELLRHETLSFNVQPFTGANIEASALAVNGIRDPHHALRGAVEEKLALTAIFNKIREEMKMTECHRAILVGHNAAFDHNFLTAACKRTQHKRNPFHPFSNFDTVTLAGFAYGHTVLAKACELAGIHFSAREAHSAIYDAEKTADLFCGVVNQWQALGGWKPPPQNEE